MANTTNFGWETPDDTDLVKDGAAAMRTLGNSIDASFVDLKGGTTGQILSKNSNTDLDFTWIANDQGDITAVTAGTGISGGGTSGAVTITNSMATEITASGDIIVGTGSGTFDNLPIGTTGQVLTADTTVSPYKVKWATPTVGKTWASIANGTIASGVSTTTITGLGGYDDILIFLYSTLTTADNKTYNLTINNTTSYFGLYHRLDSINASGNINSGEGFRNDAPNYAGVTASQHHIHISGCNSTGMKTYEYVFSSGYMAQVYMTRGYTNSTAALSSFTITSNGTLNGGTYRILGA